LIISRYIKKYQLSRNGDLTFVKRTPDKTNNTNSRVFGIVKTDDSSKKRLFCPGNIFVTKFINSILTMLKTFKINIEGECSITDGRFRNVENKKQIILTFNKISTYNDTLVITPEQYN
jgi:hypothetical protein